MATITIKTLRMDSITVTLTGRTGLYNNRMTAKAKRQLMLGGRKKTAAERLNIKHFPREEFRDSMNVAKDAHPHSHVLFPAMAIKNAMQTAALVTEGIKKTEVQRLVFLPDEMVPIFGVPKLRMGVMRSADISRTPDVRTRAYFPEWATQLDIRFSTPSLSKTGIVTLLHNAGLMVGIGDERQEKGKGSAGTFDVSTDAVPKRLLDRDAQWEAIENPVAFDADTEELLAEFDSEVQARA